MGIVRKNFLIVSSLIAGTILILLGFMAYVMPIYYNQAKQLELKKDYVTIVKELDGQSKESLLSNFKKYDQRYPNILLNLLTSSGEAVYPSASDKEIIAQSQHYLEKGNFDQIGSWSKLITSSDGEKYIVQAEYGFQSLSGVSQVLVTFYPFILLALILLSTLVAYIYSHLSTKRIKAISQTARQMQLMEEGISCQVSGQDEIAILAQDVNYLYSKLLTSIEELRAENVKRAAREEEQADFLRITAHELKTPIASMLGLVEGMIYNVGEFKDHETYLKKCRDILQEQSQLVCSILEATNLDLSLKVKQERVDLKELIEQYLTPYEALAKVHSYQFIVNLEPVWVSLNSTYFVKAIKNLLDNAFRYTKEGGAIRVSLTEHYLRIENQAEHLPDKEELDKLFLPFYRPDFSRAKEDGGTGVGLYLVKQILEKQGFCYRLEQEKEFLQFTIWFVDPLD
ncbi:ATP-binding protein [Streptococcus orisratti]|uniref:sensor histidine kinase n=2 Tax=Streptococcus orisratti TaxID=114652 RepID=UPI0003781827|nr:HAMP domain-containing sensor histidine kinase [Streptococcus orisratti]